jgi:hypothetical protein
VDGLEAWENPMVDKITKILLLLIAIGLWVNVFAASLSKANADQDHDGILRGIYARLSDIATGACTNRKIC